MDDLFVGLGIITINNQNPNLGPTNIGVRLCIYLETTKVKHGLDRTPKTNLLNVLERSFDIAQIMEIEN